MSFRDNYMTVRNITNCLIILRQAGEMGIEENSMFRQERKSHIYMLTEMGLFTLLSVTIILIWLIVSVT